VRAQENSILGDFAPIIKPQDKEEAIRRSKKMKRQSKNDENLAENKTVIMKDKTATGKRNYLRSRNIGVRQNNKQC